MTIDFELSDVQKQLQADARAFAASVLAPIAEQCDTAPTAWEAFQRTREGYRQMAKAGFTRAYIPQEYGGLGLSVLDIAIAAEELAYHDMNVPTELVASTAGLWHVIHHGTPDQKERLLRPFAEDEEGDLLAVYAFTDAGGGANYDSDDPAAGLQTTARRDGDEWVISGTKQYITNGSGWDGKGAHLYALVCRVEPLRSARESIAVIMVPGDSAGITVLDHFDKMGFRGCPSPQVRFDEVRVRADNIIGSPGAEGMATISQAFSWTSALIGAAATGMARAAFDEAFRIARSERALGSGPIIDHQAVGYKLADIKTRLEASRYLAWKACHQLDVSGGKAEELAIMAKVFCSETAVGCVYDAMQVVGINSYAKGRTTLERLMRDVLAMPIFDGGNLGMRRRQLHDLLRSEGYDPMAAAENRTAASA